MTDARHKLTSNWIVVAKLKNLLTFLKCRLGILGK